ncbi:general transcription factor II-I repeat domain-containing protein 2-like [Onthophagus taurus]|uniref:general transcription factor II-I repeat domain-containing protein 2-like n=1 Tax=Onthophagus taurus TaxID=166361 RepID=UPI0039BEC762
MSEQEKSAEAALRVCWTLSKHQKPFSDSEIMKECMLEVASALFGERKDVVAAIQSIPMSARSNTRRMEILATDIKSSLLELLEKAPCYAIALDESCDVVDDEQISIFVRFFDVENKIFREELLAILPLKGNTRGEDLFKAIDKFINNSNIRYDKIVSLSTDGAPAMIGKEKGVVKKIRDKNPSLISYQCIIHQTALCGKLSATLKEVMDSLVQLINFMRSHSSLQHRKFKKFLSECDAVYSDLLQHNNVRWLTKGQVVERFWLIKDLLANLGYAGSKEALRVHNKPAQYANCGFSEGYSEIFKCVNIELQGNGKLICDLIQSVSAFRRKLDIFEKDIARHEFIHFPTILEYKKENSEEDVAVFVRFLSDLRDEFATRFQDFAEIEKLSQFLKFPYQVDASAEWTDVAAKLFSVSKSSLQVEIIDLQEDISLQIYKTVSTEEFWGKHVSEKYENCKKVAINLATMFGSTYICESSFSKMNFSKNTYRSRLTHDHLEDILCISCTPRTPNFKKLAQDRRCNFSH